MRQPSHSAYVGNNHFTMKEATQPAHYRTKQKKQCLGECRVEFVLCLPIETGLALAVQRV